MESGPRHFFGRTLRRVTLHVPYWAGAPVGVWRRTRRWAHQGRRDSPRLPPSTPLSQARKKCEEQHRLRPAQSFIKNPLQHFGIYNYLYFSCENKCLFLSLSLSLSLYIYIFIGPYREGEREGEREIEQKRLRSITQLLKTIEFQVNATIHI